MTERHTEGSWKAGAPGLICRKELDGLSYPGTGREAAFVSKWTVSQDENKSKGNHRDLSVGLGSFA